MLWDSMAIVACLLGANDRPVNCDDEHPRAGCGRHPTAPVFFLLQASVTVSSKARRKESVFPSSASFMSHRHSPWVYAASARGEHVPAAYPHP
ncbi:hypothetical protein B0H13DRAFT_2676193 [Mycena leptocephala]|nr:hypothetical protein B0H13DRAFT_2676193 [Mycena leptocephala]